MNIYFLLQNDRARYLNQDPVNSQTLFSYSIFMLDSWKSTVLVCTMYM